MCLKNVYNLLILIFLAGVVSCVSPVPMNNGLIPEPLLVEHQNGAFEIKTTTVINTDGSEEALRMADDLRSFLKDSYDVAVQISSEKQSNAIEFVKTTSTGIEGSYALNISDHGIVIEANSYQGLFYGMQSLKQLLSPVPEHKTPLLAHINIIDEPAFKWRGMMLDVSRHFFPKDSVKKIIDVLAMHKMNKFHWHLVDGIGWRMEIDSYPELTNKGAWRAVKEHKKPWEDYEAVYPSTENEVYGGFYTKADIAEIVNYAKERYIDVIPEIEMPGHSEAALQCYPELICEGVEKSGVYCAGKEQTFEFLETIITEVTALFPNEYIHIGGDEVGKETWLQCEHCIQRMKEERLHDGEELQSYFVKRMEQFISSKNKKLIGWDEILEGGLPESATVMSWRGVKGGIEAANMGHDVVMSPGSPCYFDHSQGMHEMEPPSWGGYNSLLNVYDFNPVPNDIAPDKKHHILGGQANLWTEQIKTLAHAQYMILPRICALSEALWTTPMAKNKERFIDKMDAHFDRLKDLNYNYAESSMTPMYEVEYLKKPKSYELSLKNELDLYEIRYTLDGSEPGINAAIYTRPIEFLNPIQLNAQSYRKGIAVGYPLKKMFSTGVNDQVKVDYINGYNETYSGGGDKALFNNKFGLPRGDDPNWQGFQEKDFEILVDLGGAMELSYIGLNFFQHIGATSVMLPEQVTIAISTDGVSYTELLNRTLETNKSRDPIIENIVSEFEIQQVAFIKIVGINRGVLPEWHIRQGNAWVFVDEISIK